MLVKLIPLSCVAAATCGLLWAAPACPGDEPWFVPAKDHVALKGGEHPRLLFRKQDVPALRAKAETPVGKAIVARLRKLLGGGEAMPTVLNPNPTVNIGPKGADKLPVGAFTISHGAGFGLLHVLTGEAKYADLARRCVEKTFCGQPDRDERYAWVRPGTGFRLGTVFQGVALAYDLCYDAWDDDFRRRVVKEVLACDAAAHQHAGRKLTLENMARANGYPPGSNHYGAYIGGTGILVLAIMGDGGADDDRLAKVLATVEKNLATLLTRGFGDHGWFAEGTHPGRVSSNTGVVPLLQSLKLAGGRDYISARPNASWLTLRWVMEIVPSGGKANIPHRGDYGGGVLYARAPMISHAGEFSQGLGAVPPPLAPAVAWCYSRFVEPGSQQVYDAIMYPHHAVYAFVNWPVDAAGRAKEQNPGEVMPRAVEDKIHGYYMFRSGWKDADDILVTALLGRGPRGYKRVEEQDVVVWGLGLRTTFGTLSGQTVRYVTAEDGSAILTAQAGSAPAGTLAVDFSGTSGAPLLLVGVGPAFRAGREAAAGGASAKFTSLTVGGRGVVVLTMQKGAAPAAKAEGGKLVIGGQTVSFDGEKLVLGRFGSDGGR